MAEAPPVSTLTLTLKGGNRYRIMVMVPREKKLELTLTVVRNYSVPPLVCQLAKGWAHGAKACDYTIGNGDRAVPELGYHVGQTSQSHID